MTLKPFFSKLAEQEREATERYDLMSNPARRQEAFDRGLITVKDLDDEELRAGKCRDQFGRIPRTKGKTEPIPHDLYDEMVQEHEQRINHNLREKADRMVEVMLGVAEDPTVEPRDRLEAAKYVFERSFGKTPERVQVAVAKMPWEEMVNGIASMSRQQSRQVRQGLIKLEDVVDAEVVDEAHPSGLPGVGSYQTGEVESEDANRTFAGEAERLDPGYGPTLAEEQIGDMQYAPAEPAPTWDSPVRTSATSTNSDPIHGDIPVVDSAEADTSNWAEQNANLAEARKAAKKRIQDAKKKRAVARAMGADATPNLKVGAVEQNSESGETRVVFADVGESDPSEPG